MGNITDKYHQTIPSDNKYLDPLFDIKVVAKRTYQLGIAILFTGVCLSVYDSAIGMYVSSFLAACFCFSILMFMLLKYNDDIKDLPISIISMVCAWLIFSACLEGLQSDQYLYFFPLLISVPLLADLKKTHYSKSVVYVSIVIFSFVVCIIIGRFMHPLEDFTATQIFKLSLANRITALCTTIIFAALYTLFEKKYIEEIVEQNNRVINTKTQFLATMGHELRTPLNGIIGVVNLLKNEPDRAKQEEYIQILQYCSDHMLHQVNDILDFNKIDAGKLELHLATVNLNELILNIIKPFAIQSAGKNVTINTELDPEINAFVLADDFQLVQVINNLLANAFKFTQTGSVKLKAVCKNRNEKNLTITISVEDTGIGVDKADQERIFESFWQVYDESTKQLMGTGLSLSISSRLLKLMGSHLVLESEKGKGSKFTFDLTLAYALNPPLMPEINSSVRKNLKGISILLVEDNKINMMVAKKILTSSQAIVTSAYDGKEALYSLTENADVNLVLMDLEMPVMNGYETIYEIKKLYPKIPVIALTASLVDQQMYADLLTSGFNDCLLKPFQPEELVSKIQQYLV